VGTSDSVIKFYDESDSEEHSLLKFFLGGHRNSPICALEYQNACNLLASGSENGIVTLWDVGKGKFEASYQLHTGKITNLKFLEFYNVLLSSSMDGTICAWGHRPIEMKHKN
jgi:WD40 repeat protein